MLAVNVQLPVEKGGANGKCVFIDTEGTFRPARIRQIAEGIGADPEKVLKNIFVARAFNSDHQILLLDKVTEMIKNGEPIKLVIIDSLTAHFRAEFSGRGQLADRQQKLNRYLHNLMKLAEQHNLAVYVTNQVMSNPAQLFGDPTVAIGGNIVGHASTYRIYLRRGKKDSRVAKLIDSPDLPDTEAVFFVTEKGLVMKNNFY
jgi:DNA repair protein RadA